MLPPFALGVLKQGVKPEDVRCLFVVLQMKQRESRSHGEGCRGQPKIGLRDDPGAGLAFQGVTDMLWIGNQGFFAAIFKELNTCLNLWKHASRGEMTL